jgi:hypothetical protein
VTEDQATDFAGGVMARLQEALQLEDEWTLRTPRSLTWWGHRLAQQVWIDATPAGGEACRVHVATDLLAGVPASGPVSERLSALNRFALLSALVRDPDSGAVVLHAAASVDEGNRSWVEPLLQSAVTLQAAQAEASVEGWAEQLGGQVAESSHPESGVRKEPAERLQVMGSVFGRVGAGGSPFTEADMDALLALVPPPWDRAERAGIGIHARLPGATLMVSAETRHPQVGAGVHLRIAVKTKEGMDTADASARLNLAEARESSEGCFLGAWCGGSDDEVAFVTFLPAVMYEPGLMGQLCAHAAERVRWAQGAL